MWTPCDTISPNCHTRKWLRNSPRRKTSCILSNVPGAGMMKQVQHMKDFPAMLRFTDKVSKKTVTQNWLTTQLANPEFPESLFAA